MEFQWIEPETTAFDSRIQQPASYIRKEFSVDAPVHKATIRMSALGCYVPYLNGEKLTSRLLLPGFTDYTKRVFYQEFDVTGLIRPEKNAVGAVLGDGWFRGNLGAFNKRNVYGIRTQFTCTIELETDAGKTVIQTDETWKASQDGPLRENDLKQIEVYDARKEMSGWCFPGYDDSSWHAVKPRSVLCAVCQEEGEPIIEQETFCPEVLHTPDGSTVLDFGQNLSGHVCFRVTGKAGERAVMVMGETLDEDGNFTLKNLQGEGKSAEMMPVGQRLEYILKDGTQEYSSTFLISGYRYVKLEEWPQPADPRNFESVCVSSALKQTGTFSCSNPLINRFVQNVLWSEKSNFVDIPTDCPQRERAGWAGDVNVFLETADYLSDTRKFIRKWMHDLCGMQREDGSVPYIVPKVPMIGTGASSTGWSDAIVTIPYMQYWFYGDTDLMEEAYPYAKKWVDYNEKRAKKRNILNFYKKWFREKYILDTGHHFGEWLEPGGDNLKDGLKAFLHPDYEVATAWFYYSARILSKMAGILGKEEDEKYYYVLSSKIASAYMQFFLPTGNVISHRQCKYVRPLYMGLAPEGETEPIAKRLVDLVRFEHHRIGTGFLTTYQVLNVLTDNGYQEDAYEMMENTECPGWLYEVTQGATTVWEGWDAVRDGKLKPLSQNHYAPGAAAAWLFSRCAGICPLEPGFEKIQIRPVPGGTLTWAKASYDSVKGRIESSWKIEDGTFILDVVIPNGVPAVVILPDGSRIEDVVSGTYRCSMAL